MTKANSGSTLFDAVVGTEGGDKLLMAAKENSKAIATRVRELRTVFHSTFVDNVPDNFRKNWNAYEAAKAISKELGEEGGERYEEMMNLVKNTYTSPQNYVEVLRICGQDEDAEKYLAQREKADRVIALKNCVHDTFVKNVAKGRLIRWDVFDGARQLIRDLGEAGGEGYESLFNLLEEAATCQDSYEEAILALGGSIVPPKKEERKEKQTAEVAV